MADEPCPQHSSGKAALQKPVDLMAAVHHLSVAGKVGRRCNCYGALAILIYKEAVSVTFVDVGSNVLIAHNHQQDTVLMKFVGRNAEFSRFALNGGKLHHVSLEVEHQDKTFRFIVINGTDDLPMIQTTSIHEKKLLTVYIGLKTVTKILIDNMIHLQTKHRIYEGKNNGTLIVGSTNCGVNIEITVFTENGIGSDLEKFIISDGLEQP